MEYEKQKDRIIFYDFKGRKVIWYERDYNNQFKQHHDHQEYGDLDGISEALKDPEKICIPINKKNFKKRLIYFKDRGNFFQKWIKVIIEVNRLWDNENVKIEKRTAKLITLMYVDKISINEIQIWP